MSKIARDKWMHFFVAIPLGIALQFAANFIWPGSTFGMVIAFSILLIICYGFELFSKITGKGHYELLDAVAGIIGGVIGIALAAVLLCLW